jgi:hypothetical protein
MSNIQPGGAFEVSLYDTYFMDNASNDDLVVRTMVDTQRIVMGTKRSIPAAVLLSGSNILLNNSVGVGKLLMPTEALDLVGNIKASSNIYAFSKVGIATSNPQVALEVNTTDAILIPKGTTAQRPGVPIQGHIRYNTNTSSFEGYGAGNTWGTLGGVKDTNLDTYISAESWPTSNDDILRFYTSNNEVMRIMPNGFIGVSNQSPSERLDLKGGNAKFNSNVYVLQRLGVANSNPLDAVDVVGNIRASGNTYTLGSLGVGTLTPGATLDVIGNARVSSNMEVVGNLTVRGTTTSVDSVVVNIADNIIRVNNGASYNQTLQAGLEVNRGTGYSNYYMVFDEETRFFKIGIQSNLQAVATRDDDFASNAIAFYDTSNYKYTGCNTFVYRSGNIGIGTSNPSEALEVIRNIKASSNMYSMSRIGIATSNPTESLDLIGNVKASSNMYSMSRIGIATSNPTESLDLIGNVKASSNMYTMVRMGVANSNPTETLDVIGNVKVSSNIYTFSRIGVSTSNPAVSLEIVGTDAVLLPKGTTAQRPSAPIIGHIRYNTSINTYEGYGQGNVWGTLGGVKDINQDTYISAESYPTSNDDIIRFYNSNIETMRLSSNILDINVVTACKENVLLYKVISQSIVAYVPPSYNVTDCNFTISGLSYGNGTYAIIASSRIDSFQKEQYVFDRDMSTGWTSGPGYVAGTGVYTGSRFTTIGTSNYYGEWVQITLPDTIVPTKVKLLSGVGDIRYSAKDFFLAASSNSGSNWDSVLNTLSYTSWNANPASSNDASVFNMTTSNAYNVYRLIVNKLNLFDYARINYMSIDGYIPVAPVLPPKLAVANSNPTEAIDVTGNVKVSSNIYTMVRLGVATSNPTESLDLIGNVKASSNMYSMSRIGIATSNPTESLDLIGNVKASSNVYSMSRIGIATSNPTESLDLIGNVKASSNMYSMSRIGIATSNPTESLDLIGNVKASSNVYSMSRIGIATSNPTETLDLIGNVKASSNVYSMSRIGIATSNPTESLDLIGNVKASSNMYSMSRIGIATSNPQVALEVNTTDAILIPRGTTAQRPSVPVQGHIRYNTAINTFEGYGAGNAWGSLGGVKDTNQDTYISAESFPTSNDDILRFYTSNNEIMRIMPNGFIGVSNQTPSERMELSGGNAKFNSNVYVLQRFSVGKSNPTFPVDIIGNAAIDGSMDMTKYMLCRGVQLRKKTGSYFNSSNTLNPTVVFGFSNDNFGAVFSITSNNPENYFKFLAANSNELFRITGDGKVGVGISNPSASFEINGTDALLIPRGTTAQRPAVPKQGYVRYNTSINTFEGYGAGNAWGSLGGVKDTNQDTYISAESFPTSNDDILRFYTSNNEVMRIVSSGFIGVSNAAPSERLDLSGGNAKFGSNAYIMQRLGVGNSNPSFRADISGSTRILESTGTTAAPNAGSLVIQHGNSGGISSIVFPSTVNNGSDYGFISFYDTVQSTSYNYFSAGNAEAAAIVIGVENDVASGGSGPDSVVITPAGNVAITPRSSNTYIAGNVGIGTVSANEALHVESGKIYSSIQVLGQSNDSSNIPSFTFKQDSNTGIYHPALANIGFVTAGVERARLNSAGIDITGNAKISSNIFVASRLGVGNSNPTEVVDITGNLKVSSNIYTISSIGVGTSNPSVALEVNGSSKINSNLEVVGNLTIRGTTTTVDSTTVNIVDNIIRLNNGAAFSSSLQAGIEVNRGTGYSNYYFVFDEASDYFKIGMSGALQTVATRDDTLGANTIAFYDAVNYKYTGCNNFVYLGGKIGLGTSNPSYNIHVLSNAMIEGVFYNSNYATHGRMYFNDKNFGIGAGTFTSGSDNLYFWRYNGTGRNVMFCRTTDGFTNPENYIVDMIIHSNTGNVGIGTTTPAVALHIARDAQLSTTAYAGDAGQGQFYICGSTDLNKRLAFLYDTTTNRGYIQSMIQNTGQTPLCLNSAGGNVGIGLSNPAAVLDVNGSVRISSNISSQSSSLLIGNSSTAALGILTDNTVYISAIRQSILTSTDNPALPAAGSNARSMYIYGSNITYDSRFGPHAFLSGNVGIGMSAPGVALQIARDAQLSSTAVAGDASQGQFYICGASDLNKRMAFLYDTTTNRGYIQALVQNTGPSPLCLNSTGGNVGIGTSNPSYRLDVVGTCGVSNFIQFPNADAGKRVVMWDNGSGGYIGIGKDQFTMTLAVASSTDYFKFISYNSGTSNELMRLTGSGNLGIGTNNPGYKLEVSGAIYASGDITAFSDKRMKDDIQPIENALSKVENVSGYTYVRKDYEALKEKKGRRHIGVLAQDLQDIIPEAVLYDEENDKYGVNYGSLVAVLIEAIKDMKKEYTKEINDLKSKVSELKLTAFSGSNQPR